jgi:O-acetyl-ADP-ribose deacetylase (regulator of RNase III)
MNQVIREAIYPNGGVFQIVHGDITQEHVDAIVNAAGAGLHHGGGVAGVISRKGGPTIQSESNSWIQKHGQATHANPAYTSGGNLPCKYIIHAVGPIWGSGDEDRKLTAAITGSFNMADELGLESIAFPAISTGIFGFPKERAARIIFDVIDGSFTGDDPIALKNVRLVLFDRATVDIFLHAWDIRKQGDSVGNK